MKENSNFSESHIRSSRRGRNKETFFDFLYRILRGAFLTFIHAKGSEASASLAYYTVFSLFPLLIVIVSLGSYLVDQSVVEKELLTFLPQIVPVSQDYLLTNISALLKVRGTVSLISLAGLIWSSTSVFATLIRNINSAWPAAAPHTYLKMRLASLGIVAILAILLIINSFSITIKNLIIALGISLDFDTLGAFFSSTFFTQVLPVIIRTAALYGIYYLVPQIKVKKYSALAGSILTSFLWQLVTFGLNSYLRIRLTHYEIIYGSLAKVIVLLAWIYFISYIVLFGAHLTSSIDRHTD